MDNLKRTGNIADTEYCNVVHNLLGHLIYETVDSITSNISLHFGPGTAFDRKI